MARKIGEIIKSQNIGLVKETILRVRLIWKLMTDRRVNFLLKILPVAALAYLVSPIDLASGIVLPVIGAMDDAAILWIGTTLFVNLCPADVVEEHWKTLSGAVAGSWKDAGEKKPAEIVDVVPTPEEEEKPQG